MSIQTKSPSQGLLFSEPAYSETAVWCELNDGIDPAVWAYLCRKIGYLPLDKFKLARKHLFQPIKNIRLTINVLHPTFQRSPDSLISRLKRLFYFNQEDFEHLPLVSIGTKNSKINVNI